MLDLFGYAISFSSSLNKLYKDILTLGYTMYATGEPDAGPLFTKSMKQIGANSIIAKYHITF